MDTDKKKCLQEIQDNEAKISKMISEGGIGVTAYYNYDSINHPTTDKPQLTKNTHNNTDPHPT